MYKTSHLLSALLNDVILLHCVCFSVKTPSENGTFGPVAFSVSSEGHNSASFPVSSLVQLISVSVTAQNALGSVASSPVVYRLSDIGKTAAVSVWCVCEVLSLGECVVLHAY